MRDEDGNDGDDDLAVELEDRDEDAPPADGVDVADEDA